MNRRARAMAWLTAGLLLAAGGFLLGRATGPRDAPAAIAAPAAERSILYWHDPMVPGPRFDKPGKSPFMDMQLVPVYADQAGTTGTTGVTVSPAVQQSLGIRTATVAREDVRAAFDAVGTVQFDERLSVAVQTRVAGYVEHLAVRAPMEQVRKGQALATLFAPEWLGPLNELLALQRAGAAADIVDAARERMQALSIPPELVRRSEDSGVAQARYTLQAPAGGVVTELGVRQGAQVTPGMTLFRISGLHRVWAVAEVPEAQAVGLVRGQKVQAVLQADASQAFTGALQEILPQVHAGTRSLQARFEVDNRSGKLVPGLLLRLQLSGPSASRLLVPTEAVLRTGTRALAIVRQDPGRFEPREIQLGEDFGDRLEVREGLREGERVVTSGQFLLDSEARLKSALGAMAASPAGAAPAAASDTPGIYRAEGKVERIDADGITISHGPVPALQWPAMTMGFGKADATAFSGLQAGDAVRFAFRKGGPMDWEVVSVHKAGGAR